LNDGVELEANLLALFDPGQPRHEGVAHRGETAFVLRFAFEHTVTRATDDGDLGDEKTGRHDVRIDVPVAAAHLAGVNGDVGRSDGRRLGAAERLLEPLEEAPTVRQKVAVYLLLEAEKLGMHGRHPLVVRVQRMSPGLRGDVAGREGNLREDRRSRRHPLRDDAILGGRGEGGSSLLHGDS
jgi:hypothetical protein